MSIDALSIEKRFSTPTRKGYRMPGPSDAIQAANALQVVRPELGTEAGIGLYRLLRLVALEEIIGRGIGGTVYIAGKRLGMSLGLESLEAFLDLCKQLKIGIIDVPKLTNTEAHIDVYECVTCSGMTPVGRTLCHFEGGLIAGVAESVLQQPVRAIENTCIGGLGHKACGFDLTIGKDPHR